MTLYIFKTAISSSFDFFFTKHIVESLILGTNVLYSYVTITYLHFLLYHRQRLASSTDIEVNAGPMLEISQYLIGT